MRVLLDDNLCHKTPMAFTRGLVIIWYLCYHFKEARIRVIIEEQI